jgi:hypothetical protein
VVSHYYWGSSNSSGVQTKHVRVSCRDELGWPLLWLRPLPLARKKPISATCAAGDVAAICPGAEYLSACIVSAKLLRALTPTHVCSSCCRVEESWMTEPGSRILTGCALAGNVCRMVERSQH